MRRPLADESGNALLELVVAVVVFGGLVLPAVSAISTVAVARRQADTAAWAVARGLSLAPAASRWPAAAAVTTRLQAASVLPLAIDYGCLPDCDAVAARFFAVATVQVGLPAVTTVSRRVEVGRDAFAE